MSEQPTRIEMNVPADQVDATVASVCAERIGLTGWIIDHTLGANADLDEVIAGREIAALVEKGLARLSPSRRLEATIDGANLWKDHKPTG